MKWDNLENGWKDDKTEEVNIVQLKKWLYNNI